MDLKRKYKFILIGGWAVWIYTKALKSKDIDIIVDYKELEKLKEDFNLLKNVRLKKYEIKSEEADIDIYLPYFSELGLKVEAVMGYIQSYEGFSCPWPEALLILKQAAYQARRGTIKGRKDELDIVSLLVSSKVDFKRYYKILSEHQPEKYLYKLKDLIQEIKDVKELNLNQHQFSRLRKKIFNEIDSVSF